MEYEECTSPSKKPQKPHNQIYQLVRTRISRRQSVSSRQDDEGEPNIFKRNDVLKLKNQKLVIRPVGGCDLYNKMQLLARRQSKKGGVNR